MSKNLIAFMVVGVVVVFGAIATLLYFNPIGGKSTATNNQGGNPPVTQPNPDPQPEPDNSTVIIYQGANAETTILPPHTTNTMFRLVIAEYNIHGWSIREIKVDSDTTIKITTQEAVNIFIAGNTKIEIVYDRWQGSPITGGGHRLDLSQPPMPR